MQTTIETEIDQTLERPEFCQLRRFLDAAPDPMFVLDEEGRILWPNRLVAEIFGYAPGELQGRTFSTLLPERLWNEEIPRFFPKTAELPANVKGHVLTGIRKDHTEFPMEISFSRFEMDARPFCFAIVRDISNHYKAEAKFRGLLESAPDGIIVVGKRGQITIANTQAEKMFGYARHELLGKSIEILVPERYHGTHVHDREVYTDHPRTRPMGAGRYLTGRKKDGTEFPVEISLSPMETEQGVLITSIIRDITDRRQAEEQIKASPAREGSPA